MEDVKCYIHRSKVIKPLWTDITLEVWICSLRSGSGKHNCCSALSSSCKRGRSYELLHHLDHKIQAKQLQKWHFQIQKTALNILDWHKVRINTTVSVSCNYNWFWNKHCKSKNKYSGLYSTPSKLIRFRWIWAKKHDPCPYEACSYLLKKKWERGKRRYHFNYISRFYCHFKFSTFKLRN